ncbi:MAG: hypothetical protein AAFZ91_16200 [Pseudomonadota bacterium]
MKSSNTRALQKLSALAALGVLAACETTQAIAETGATTMPEAVVVNTETGEGLYYPMITGSEAVDIRFAPMPGVGPTERQFLVDQLNFNAMNTERDIPIVLQTAGTDSRTLVIMNIEPETFLTPYVARALLARMTSISRFMPAIAEMGLSSEIDFYNMCAMAGFERLIVTDGRGFSHEFSL